MTTRDCNEFPNGIIEIFKVNKIYDLNILDCQKKGDVICDMDNEIGRKIIKIEGNLGPSNNLVIPNPKYTRGLNYTGKNYYIFFKAFNDKKFSFQFTFTLDKRIIRFMFKYPLNNVKHSKTNSFNIEVPIPINETNSDKWIIYHFDPIDFITNTLKDYSDFSEFKDITEDKFVLKSFQAFSTVFIRGLYITKSQCSLDCLPREMSVRTLYGQSLVELLCMDANNVDGKNIEKGSAAPSRKVKINKVKQKPANTEEEKLINERTEKMNKHYEEMLKNEAKRKRENIVSKTKNKIDEITNQDNEEEEEKQKKKNSNDLLKEMESVLLSKNKEIINKDFIKTKKETLKSLFKNEEQKRTSFQPDPVIDLNYIIGYSSQNCPYVVYNSHGDYGTNPNLYSEADVNPTKKHIYFCSGSNLIKFDPVNIKQKFFKGHSKPITNFITACKGEIIFSNQEGVNSIIRIWDTQKMLCIKMLTTPFDQLKIMAENKDSTYLCTVGKEQNKLSIIIYNIEKLNDINVFIRQSVPTDIKAIKFSPYKIKREIKQMVEKDGQKYTETKKIDEDILFSCGRENIKSWRMSYNPLTGKADHLSGKAVVLTQFARGNDFLCLDFNNTMFGDNFDDKGKVYVGSAGGCIFQVACNNQELEAVYKVQDSAILSLAVNEAFCAAGSQDGYLRIWPIDFSEFIIEAKHDTGVCSIDISYDALEILCGTQGGSIGILNIQTKEYKTILRSPPNIIKSLIIHPSGNYLFTIEGDNSVRIWDIENKAEVFQFVSSKDPPVCVAAPHIMTFVCGFSSGIIKIFDLEKTEILFEEKPFKTSVNNLLFIQNDKILVSMSAQGNICLHDCSNNYFQIKEINIDTPAVYTDISLAVEADYFATIGSESNCAIVWNCETFGMKNRVPVSNFFIKRLCLINRNLLACILDNCCVRFYALGTFEGVLIKELMNLHINNINQFIVSHNFKYLLSSGEEGMIKVWDMKMVFKTIQSYQQFIGHATGVKGLILLENKGLLISTSENSGIYFWNFLGDTTFTESEIVQEMEKLNSPSYVKMLEEKSLLNSTSGGKSINISTFSKTDTRPKGKQPLLSTKDIRARHMEKIYNASIGNNTNNPNFNIIEKWANEDNNLKDVDLLNEFKVLPYDKEDKNEYKIIRGINPETEYDFEKYKTNNLEPEDRKNQEVMDKIMFTSKYKPSLLDRSQEPEAISNKLKLKYCLGLSVNSMNNLVLNKNKWYAYTVNNKVIVELFETERKQIILADSKDELSCLIKTKDGKYLICAVGCTLREEYAPIFVYETKNFTLKKKLNFHFKGVQNLAISNDSKYMISLGTIEEKSICVWNFTNLTVIDSKSIKFNAFTAVIECRNAGTYISTKGENNEDDPIIEDDDEEKGCLFFVTAAQHVLSFWRVYDKNSAVIDNMKKEQDEENKETDFNNNEYRKKFIPPHNYNFELDGFHLNFEDLCPKERKPGEYITGITLTKYYEQFRTSFVLIGTNKGKIMIVKKREKSFMKAYHLFDYPITKIFFWEKFFICGGEVPQVLYTSPKKTESEWKVFDFLDSKNNKNKPKKLFLDGAINSFAITDSEEEGLLTTDVGTIIFVNFVEETCIKIISSHIDCNITSLECDVAGQNLYTTGRDGGIRSWTMDSYDHKVLIEKANFKRPSKGNKDDSEGMPNNCILNHKNNILINQYDYSYLSLINLNVDYNFLGKIDLEKLEGIDNSSILFYDLIFNSNALLLFTENKTFFVVDVKTWDPLSVLFIELFLKANDFPKVQDCKDFHCKSISDEKSFATMSFNDGSVFTFILEKVDNKVIIKKLDSFNMMETYLDKFDDEEIKDKYHKEIMNYKTNYKSSVVFSNHFHEVIIGFHESIQFLFVRNFQAKQTIKLIPLTYFPYSIALSDGDDKYIAVGTKEGLVLLITRGEENYNSCFNLDVSNGHYDTVDVLKFSHDTKQLLSASRNEIFVWEIKK